jgi:hypothetical protein
MNWLSNLVIVSGLILSGAASADIGFTPVTDQQYTLQCWAVSISARLDVSASRTAGKLLKLSPKYLVYAKTRAEVLDLILNKKFELYEGLLCEECEHEQIYYEQGGILLDGIETARVHGVMPEVAYGGFPEEDSKLFHELNQFIAGYAALADSADFSSRQFKKQLDRDLSALLDKYLGHPPDAFEFEGKRYTPRTFFNAYLPDWRKSKARELDYAPEASDGRSNQEAFNGSKYLVYTTGNHDRLMAVISETLKAGEPALLQYKAYDDYHTQDKGHIGFAVQGIPVVAPTVALWNSLEVMTHYVLAIGGEWDQATGQLTRIMIKNTWGVSAEENYGFHWIETDFLPWMEAIEIHDGLEPKFRRMGLLP